MHYVLVRCDKCNWNHEQIAVVDEKGEDCNTYEKMDEVRRDLNQNPRHCDCGEKLYATVSESVVEQYKTD